MLPRLEPHECRKICERKGGEIYGDAQRRCLALVQNGHPMKAVNTQHEAVLGVSEVAARAFSKKCFCNEEAGDCSYLKTAEVYLVQIIPERR